MSNVAIMKVNFASCVHDSVDFGSDDQHIVSRVFFSIWCEGLRYAGLHADIKHPVDGDFENDAFEITLPHGYDGPISPEGFRRAVGQYYRSLIDGIGLGFQTVGGNIRMRDHTYLLPRSFELPLGGG